MSIRAKTILSLFITMVAMILILYLALCRIVSGGFGAVEDSSANRNVERVRETFAKDVEALCAKTSDWATWDSAYQFVQDRNPGFIQENIAPSAMSGMGLAAILVFDKGGEIVASTSYYAAGDRLAPVPPQVIAEHFSQASPLVRHAKADDRKSGLLFTPGSPPLVFCSLPVLPTSGEGEVRGAMVFAKWFDRAAHEQLMRTTKLQLAFGEEGAPGTPAAIAAQLKGAPADKARVLDLSNPKTLLGYTRFDDFYGKKSLIARFDMPREVLAQAQTSCRFLALALVAFGLVFTVVTVLLVETGVLRRLARLSSGVTRITESFDFGARVDDRSKDELGKLGLSINRLLAAVEQIQHAKLAGLAKPSTPPAAPTASAPETEGDHG
jgi:sensor domain CHASE-containing protein